MGDESQADYQNYIAGLPKAPVVWLLGCRACKATGINKEGFSCANCVADNRCPRCGHSPHRYGSLKAYLVNCTRCGWRKT